MSRTLEHIISCHNAAADRRRQGKPVWSNKLTLKGILPDGCDSLPSMLNDEQAASLGKRFAEQLRLHPFTRARIDTDHELQEVVEIMEDISASPSMGISGQDELNESLDLLYDWADDHRMWVELR